MLTNRDEELRKIDEFVKSNQIKIGPTAFVCPTLQAMPVKRDSEFVHIESYKRTWVRKRSKK